MVEIVLKLADVSGVVAFIPPDDEAMRAAIKNELQKCRQKFGGYVMLTMQPPYKRRTTGSKSQNHHLNGHIMQICSETGASYSSVKDEVKRLAVENMGYPYEEFNGRLHPIGESASDTASCAKLIEAAHVLAADLGIILRETE